MRENQSKSSNPKSSGKDKDASRKEEEKDVPLDDIAENVSSYFKKFSQFKKYEKDIKKKYKKYYDEPLPECWPVKFINRAWRKIETMHTFSGRRKCWSLAILFQVMKRSRGYDENKREAQSDVKKESQQSGGDPSANEPVYIRIPFSEMINGKECYRSDTDAEDNESKTSETDEKDKESKTSETDEKDIIESPKNKEYKLIDKVPSPTQILQNQFYITLYDNQTRNAAWVYEILNKGTLANNNVDKKTDFIQDASVHPLFQPSTNPYTDTGYDRGHLAAAANHRWCQQALDDTYWLSNIIPQQHDFNSGMWKKLEEYCRELAKTEGVRNVHVYTGLLYLSSDRESTDNKDINRSEKCVEYEFVGGKAVPTHLFKVIIVEDKDGKVLAPKCYKMPNANDCQKNSQTKLPILTSVKLEKPLIKVFTKDPTSNIYIDDEDSTNWRCSIEEKLKQYKVEIEDIQRDSGLIFEEREVKEKITDATWKVRWRAKERVIWREVKVSGSYTDHSDRAVLH